MNVFEQIGLACDTPPVIDGDITDFAASLVSRTEPVYVEVRPIAGAEVSHCFENVEACVAAMGGKAVVG